MVTIAYTHDGSNEYDLLFLKSLSKKHRVYFLTFNSDSRFVPKETVVVKLPGSVSASGKAEGFYMYAFSLLRAVLLGWYLRRIKPDIVLGCLATKYGFYSALSGFKPFILIIWGSDILIAPQRFFLLRVMAKFTINKADAVIVDSKVQETAAIRLGCDPKKILRFPWFDVKSMRIRRSKSEIRKQLGWRDNPIVISLRRHEPIYRVKFLIEAIPHIVAEVPDCRFLILGSGSLHEKLKRRVNELKVEQYVKFLGQVPVDEVATYLNAADVYVSTSASDGTSASLLEAMTFGIAPVVTSIPGNREWVENGRNGYLVPVGDSQRLAEKITWLIKNENIRLRIGKNATKCVNAKVDWRKNLKALGNLIFSLVNKYGREG